MKYFLIKLELKVVGNLIGYCRPDWYVELGLPQYEANYTNTTLADTFVDVVIGIEDLEKIKILEDRKIVELSEVDYESWKKYKQLILSLNPIIDEEVI